MRQRLPARRLLGAVAALLTLVLPACSGDRPADAASAATAAATVGNRYTSVGPVRLADTRSRFGTSPPGRVPGNGTVVVQVTGRPEVAIPAGAIGRGARRGLRGGRRVVVHHGVALGPAAAAGVEPQRRPRRGRRGQHGHDAAVDRRSGVALHQRGGRPRRRRVRLLRPGGRCRHRRPHGRRHPHPGLRLALVGWPPGRRARRARSGCPRASCRRDAVAAVLNLTVTETRAAGYWTIFPPGTLGPGGRPLTSNTNASGPGQTVAVQAVVPLGANRTVQVFSQTGGHAIVDVFGYVTGPSSPSSTDGLFVPLASTASASPTPAPPTTTRSVRHRPPCCPGGPPRCRCSAGPACRRRPRSSPRTPPTCRRRTPATSRSPRPAPRSRPPRRSTPPRAGRSWPTTRPSPSAPGRRGVLASPAATCVLDVSGGTSPGAPQPSVLPRPGQPDAAGRPAARWSTSATRPPVGLIERRCSRTRPTGSTPSTPGSASQDIRLEIKGARSIVETLPGDLSAYQVAQNVRAAGFRGCWVLAPRHHRHRQRRRRSRPAGSTGWPASTA